MRLSSLIAAIALLVFAVTGPGALAQSSSSSSGLLAPPITGVPSSGTSAPSGSSNSLSAICGSTLQQAASPTAAEQGSSTFTQLVTYCQAAQQAQKAANDDAMLWKVWAGVAGICTTACITSFTMAHEALGKVCMMTNIGASVTSAIVTQNFASSLMGLAPIGLGLANKGHSSSASSSSGGSGKHGDIAACLSAATATIEVFTTEKDESSQQQTENTNLQAASQLSNTGSASSSGTTSATPISPTSDTTASSLSVAGAPSLTVEKGTNFAQTGDGSATCNTPGFACALAMDSQLPSFVSSPGFASELQKNSGLDPDQFMNSTQTPAQAILGASGGAGMNSSGLQTYAGMLGDLAAQFQGGEPPNSVYAGGHGGGGGGGGAAPDDTAAFGAAMAGLMKTLNPNAEKEKAEGHSANNISFPTRTPAYNADDPSFSIFDRVSFRYRYVSERLER